MERMGSVAFPELAAQFRQLLVECRDLYVSSGEFCAREYPQLTPRSGDGFVTLMDDLHRALLVKVFVTICESDRRWSSNECALAEVLLFHLWGEWLKGDVLKEAILEMSQKASALKWYAVVRPFDQIAPLRDRVGELETIVTRLANIIARAEGPLRKKEAEHIKMIQDELHLHLRQIPIDEHELHGEANEARVDAMRKIERDANQLPESIRTANSAQAQANRDSSIPGGRVAVEQESAPGSVTVAPPEEQLPELLAELDRLVGLANIKQEVRTLANFLRLQSQREQAGLPTTSLSLHMVFGGNPGTGKTTVARIVAKIFGAMGVLKKGHLVETDRSGLVAEYAGQTGPKTNERINEALDGVLFIDEAYTLISREGDDPFGNEAVQALLKRMEDDRDRLVVILAGYTDEMQCLMQSNPGLSSRFSRNLHFEDYSPLELAQIFGILCEKNHYTLQSLSRARVIVGLDHWHRNRDRYFGNGRAARNLFEHSIRHMANRIAEIPDLSMEMLSTLEPEDIEFENVPPELFSELGEASPVRFHIRCPECCFGKDASMKFLGQNVRCPKCKHHFTAAWGSLVEPDGSAA